MKTIKYFTYLVFFIVVYSCTESINLDLENGATNRLIVEGSITNEHKVHSVTLTRTSEFLVNDKTPRELNATVIITDGDTTINLYDGDDDGTYETERELAGKVNHTYTLDILLNNGEQYSATEILNPIVPLDSIAYEYKKSDIPFSEDYIYNLNIFVQEPPEPDQFYQWDFYLDGVHQTDTINTKRFEADDFVNGTYFYNWTVFEVEEDRIEKEEVEVRLQMRSISEEKYDFYMAVLFETDFSGSFFSGPPSNVPSNISNGALGFFSASAVTEKTMIIKRVGGAP